MLSAIFENFNGGQRLGEIYSALQGFYFCLITVCGLLVMGDWVILSSSSSFLFSLYFTLMSKLTTFQNLE